MNDGNGKLAKLFRHEIVFHERREIVFHEKKKKVAAKVDFITLTTPCNERGVPGVYLLLKTRIADTHLNLLIEAIPSTLRLQYGGKDSCNKIYFMTSSFPSEKYLTFPIPYIVNYWKRQVLSVKVRSVIIRSGNI